MNYSSKHELLQRILNFEDNYVERKLRGNSAEFRKTLVAFANSLPDDREAVLFIGIDDAGSIVGLEQNNSDSLQKTIFNIAQKECYPPIKIYSECLIYEDKTILAVVIPSSTNKPHFSGPAYIRVGSQSVVASEEQFNELILSRNSKIKMILGMRGKTIALKNPRYSYTAANGTHFSGLALGEIIECDPYRVKIKSQNNNFIQTFQLEKLSIGYEDSLEMDSLVVMD
jgi:hypothetical protein